MDPILDERQNDQPQEKQSRQGTNRLLSSPIRGISSRVITQAALRGFSALLASQVGLPILIAVVLILVFTFIIVGFGGGIPPSETNIQGSNLSPTPTQIPIPTETITPTQTAP
jgi:hypothetical protein